MEDIKDEELDKMLAERKEKSELTTQNEVKQFAETEFGKRMTEVKVNVLEEAQQNDEQFVETVKSNLKKAAVTATEVEQEKQEYEKQQVQAESEKLSRAQKQNEHKIKEDVWANRQKRRQYHFDGVKPIMSFVEIKEPMNLFVLYFLTVVLIVPFLLAKLWRGTIGALIAGGCDSNRPKFAKGFIWTLLALAAACVLGGLIYLFLKWQQIV